MFNPHIAAEVPSKMGRTCAQNGRPSPAKDHSVRRAAIWETKCRGTSKRYKDRLKSSLKACNIDPRHWSTLAADRIVWRHTIQQAVSAFEVTRRTQLEDKRKRRKESSNRTPTTDQTFTCNYCSRTCLSRIGLVSHQRACSGKHGQQP